MPGSETEHGDKMAPRDLDGDRRSVIEEHVSTSGSGFRARWLLVVVPLAVIVATGSWLVHSWSARLAYGAGRVARHDSLPTLPSRTPSRDADRPLTAVEILRKIEGRQPPSPAVPISSSQPPWLPQPQVPVEAAPVPPRFSPGLVVARLATADLEEGEKFFKICSTCHLADPSGASRIGPNLWNSVGARKAAKPGYRYSAALSAKGGSWTYEELALYLHNPRSAVPGTSMSFAGITSPERLANVIAYMRTLSDQPPPRSGSRP